MRVVADIETDSLNPTKIWCVVAQDVDTKKWYEFERPDLDGDSFREFASCVDQWIGHHFLGFDGPVLEKFRLLGPKANILDTAIVSRLLNYPIAGGHSLFSWGVRFGVPKPPIEDFKLVSMPDIKHRCREDVKINMKLYEWQKKYLNSKQWKDAIYAEHRIASICDDLHKNGFWFNKEEADRLFEELSSMEESLRHALQEAFPPEKVITHTYMPRTNKDGTINRQSVPKGEKDLTKFTPGVPYHVYDYVEFNPGSPKQVVERLNDAGWQPTAKTKGHVEQLKSKVKDKTREEAFSVTGWKVNEENLETLPDSAPEASRKLVQWLLINNRKKRLEEWFKSYDANTHRIHGSFMHIGAWTHRMAHQSPNMGNVPSVDSKYNGAELRALAKSYGIRLRSLWTVPEGRSLIGVDADSIQLRVLAHYMNDPEFTNALINGRKEDDTDAHTLNAIKLGFDKSYRAKAKTFIYAFLLGAGYAKVATILGISVGEARERVDDFVRSYPGLERLKKEQIPRDSRRGYFEGFDGRLVPCKSDHLMLAGYLQNGESCIMKHATIDWYDKSTDLDYLLVNFVHDEWDTEVNPDHEDILANLQCDSIRIVGEKFGLNCPMAGSIKKGKNWYDVH